MPFTLSHPAAILPIRRTYLPLSALVVGSLAPDFEYLIHLQPKSLFSHSLPGVFLFCVPSGFLVLWLFHSIWKKPLIILLPDPHQTRLLNYVQDFPFKPFTRFLMICASLIIGSLTHIAWDAFTHSYGWAVKNFPVFTTPLLQIHGYRIRVYKILQHGSSAAGMLLILIIYLNWFKKEARLHLLSPSALRPLARWLVIFVIASSSALMGMLCAFLKIQSGHDPFSFKTALGFAIPSFFLVLIIELTLYGLYQKSREKLKRV